ILFQPLNDIFDLLELCLDIRKKRHLLVIANFGQDVDCLFNCRRLPCHSDQSRCKVDGPSETEATIVLTSLENYADHVSTDVIKDRTSTIAFGHSYVELQKPVIFEVVRRRYLSLPGLRLAEGAPHNGMDGLTAGQGPCVAETDGWTVST